jgi:hypothetical protein
MPLVDLHKLYSLYITLMLVNKFVIRTMCLSKWLTSEIWLDDTILL